MTFRAALISAIILMAPLNAAADAKDIENKVGELNAQSMKLLGVSLNAVRYLVGASSTSYLLLSYLERSGEINYIRELEAKGYVKTQVVQGLPDGTQKQVKHLRVIPIGDGVELQRCVEELPHNPAVNTDAAR
jgi:hypothetical protein